MKPRSAAEVGEKFPYTQGTVCVIEIDKDGTVSYGGGADAYRRAAAGDSRLFAVWPGQWQSDLFEIDDLDEYARALGLIHDQKRSGLVDHEHDFDWTQGQPDSPRSPYVPLQIVFKCGCTIKDLRAFADQMKLQRGWDVARSGGWSGYGAGPWTVRVRRSSLRG